MRSLSLFLFGLSLIAQNAPPAGRGGAAPVTPTPAATPTPNPNDTVLKALDDIMWVQKLSDIADVDKVAYASKPPAHILNKTGPGAANPLIIRAYTFIPKKMDRTKKQPLLVLAHQGIHGNVSSVELAHIIREMMEQGYAVIAPDYRGSTGYGQGFSNQIDYGGREVDDVLAGKAWMLEKYPFLDPKRVGAIGWSHGGLITLMEILTHPDAGYAVAYAG